MRDGIDETTRGMLVVAYVLTAGYAAYWAWRASYAAWRAFWTWMGTAYVPY